MDAASASRLPLRKRPDVTQDTGTVDKCIGRYRLDKVVGRGGLGVVYRAVDTRSGKEVALKLMSRPIEDETVARRLNREFRALSMLQHKNIVRVLDAGHTDDDVPFLAMELVHGLPLRGYLDVSTDNSEWSPKPPPAPEDSSIDRTLSVSHPSADPLSWLSHDAEEPDSLAPMARRCGTAIAAPLTPEELERLNDPVRVARLRDVLAQLCDGLAFIHERALVHRDVKPSNVLVSDDGCAKLVDFGLVKLTTSSGNTTATGRVVGTYRYMSPEQARGESVDGRSDLYAVGSVLYEMIAGRPAFAQAGPSQLLHAIVSSPPPAPETYNPHVDPTLAGIASRLLRKDPAERFQSAQEVAQRLRAAGGSRAGA